MLCLPYHATLDRSMLLSFNSTRRKLMTRLREPVVRGGVHSICSPLFHFTEPAVAVLSVNHRIPPRPLQVDAPRLHWLIMKPAVNARRRRWSQPTNQPHTRKWTFGAPDCIGEDRRAAKKTKGNSIMWYLPDRTVGISVDLQPTHVTKKMVDPFYLWGSEQRACDLVRPPASSQLQDHWTLLEAAAEIGPARDWKMRATQPNAQRANLQVRPVRDYMTGCSVSRQRFARFPPNHYHVRSK